MFIWDDANTAHVARHDITPAEAEQVILNDPIDLGLQIRDGEERFAKLGETSEGRILRVIVTRRSGLIRVVTAHPASRIMRSLYEESREEPDD